jgi:septal ring factor EnvC (AmiA/AmiB activator)
MGEMKQDIHHLQATIDTHSTRLDRVETQLDRVDTRLDRVELLLTQILERLPEKP